MTTTPRDLHIDQATGDITLTDGAASWASGDALVRQRVGIRLRTQTGEWAYDTSMGLPYRERILIKNPDINMIRGLVVSVVKATRGVRSVTRCEPSLDRLTRRLSVRVVATTTTGTSIAQEIATP